ncbi:hypothetical protein [Enterobacter kobei]|uniref:hypothetical protein n=1 Tax=Enterobacter kobei TaxID=208224 RepID=UPI002A80F24A|nr:hypothetical protein [Enterobacter kobei]
MMSELRVGGMALVIKTYRIHENLGKSVIVEKIINPGKRFKSIKTGSINENATDEILFYSSGDLKSPFPGEDGAVCFGREQLMPIDGEDFSHEDERQKELTNG